MANSEIETEWEENKITAINTWAVAIFRYRGGRDRELKSIDDDYVRRRSA